MTGIIKNYLLLTKPWIILGNLIATSAGFFFASKGNIDALLLSTMLIGISLVIASACVFNNCIDRRIDAKMVRTKHRAIPSGIISTNTALLYAATLGIIGAVWLYAMTTTLVVAIALAGWVIYVGIYSLYMKRRSVYSALVGSLAGAAPPLAGYCTVSGSLDGEAILLFLVFSLWQIPHCYAIAVFRFDDYTAADVPVLPVQRGILVTRHHTICYILAFTASMLLLTLCGYTGYLTLSMAALLGIIWLYLALDDPPKPELWAKNVYVFSIVAMLVLCFMISIDFTAPISARISAMPAP
jgi:protoheme IX farnesyltransferase